jgi:ubiquinone/menaquinone biosynthesis C-methylase UbiE
MDKLNTFFQEKHVSAVLDVGTGSGAFIPVLREAFPKAEICGIDPNAESLNEAAELFPDLEFKTMSGENITYPDNRFDVVAISMALHHLPNVPQTLHQMRRVLKPGGWIIINELFSDNLNAAQEVHKSMHHFRSRIDRLLGVSHNKTFTKQQIIDIIQSNSLSICLHFENGSAAKKLSNTEVAERMDKLHNHMQQVQGHSVYSELAKQLPEIEGAIRKHGMAMATRLVAVAQKNANL